MKNLRYILLVVSLLSMGVWAAATDLPNRFEAGDLISAAELNANFDAINLGKQEKLSGSCGVGSTIQAISESGKLSCVTVLTVPMNERLATSGALLKVLNTYDSSTATGFEGESNQGFGVLGVGRIGLYGDARPSREEDKLNSMGVFGFNTQGGSGVVARSTTETGTALRADNTAGGLAARFTGDVTMTGDLFVDGNILATGIIGDPASSRHLKMDFTKINSHEVLAKVIHLPMYTWRYKNDPSVLHMGTFSEEFSAAFGLGRDNKHISTIDADGVAFAAIQGLYELLEVKDATIKDLESRIQALESAQ